MWKLFEKLKKVPKRFAIAVMMFLACLAVYMMRVNLSINIVAMVKPPGGNASLPDYGTRYEWSQDEQGYLLGAYFYGYMITSLPAGIVAAYLGGRNVVGYSTVVSAILTVLQPYAAGLNIWILFTIRFLIGLLGGFLYPAFHHLISKWSPPDEKGKFVASLMGGTFGTVITLPICGVITEAWGYKWAFHVTAIISGVIGLLWFLIVADEPAKDSRISVEERSYIEKSLAKTVTKVSKWPPMKDLLLSLPFWALLVLHYGNLWGLYFLITAAPKFLAETLEFKLSEAGFLSSLPHLARLLLAIAFGQIGDCIKRKELLSVTFVRKFFTIFSHFIPGALLIVMAYFGRDPYVCVALLTLSLGVNGAASITNLQNSQDLAPNYAGTIYGIINFFGTTPGFFSPMIVALFTKDQNTVKEWRYVFIIGAAAYIIPAVLFIIFGSGKVQYWNDKENKTDSENSKANSKRNQADSNDVKERSDVE